MYKQDPKSRKAPGSPIVNPMADPRLRQMLKTPVNTGGVSRTAQTSATATPPPSRLPEGMNPNFKPPTSRRTPMPAQPMPATKPTVSGSPAMRPTPMPAQPMPVIRPQAAMPPGAAGKLNNFSSKLGMAGVGSGKPTPTPPSMMKKGGSVNSSASKRADGIATRGKTKGKMC